MVLSEVLILLDNISVSDVMHVIVLVIYLRFILSHNNLRENFIFFPCVIKEIGIPMHGRIITQSHFYCMRSLPCEYHKTSNVRHTKLQN